MWHFKWYFAVFIMIRFVSGKLPDAYNIKVNSMFILCWGGHASIPIFYILSLSIPLHLIYFLSTVRLLISKCFANSVHNTSSHSWDIWVALWSTLRTYTAAHSLQTCTLSVIMYFLLRLLYFRFTDEVMKHCLYFFYHLST